eukprot:1135262-Pleurochrysis_carterae.AAC.1
MIHGDSNARYVQRKDEQLKTTGKDKPGYSSAVSGPQLFIVQAMSVDTVLTKVAAIAVWPC